MWLNFRFTETTNQGAGMKTALSTVLSAFILLLISSSVFLLHQATDAFI
jgi:hypothetical protein